MQLRSAIQEAKEAALKNNKRLGITPPKTRQTSLFVEERELGDNADCIVIWGRIYSSKNSRQIFKIKGKTGKTRTIVAKSDNSKLQEQSFAVQLAKQKDIWEKMVEGKSYPLSVEFTMTVKDRGRWDWGNSNQGIADAMVKAGFFPDDSANYFHPVYNKVYTIDKNNPCCKFRVL